MKVSQCFIWIYKLIRFFPLFNAADLDDIKFNKSNPKPCDKEFDLYELAIFTDRTLRYSYTCDSGCSR